MKTLFAFLVVVFLGTTMPLQAARPIPSYKAPVTHRANFEEKHHKDGDKMDPKGKRNMIIVSNVIGPAKLPMTIWVYSLDGKEILGPYTIIGSGELVVPIDGRPWGIVVEFEGKATVSVWTDDMAFE